MADVNPMVLHVYKVYPKKLYGNERTRVCHDDGNSSITHVKEYVYTYIFIVDRYVCVCVYTG